MTMIYLCREHVQVGEELIHMATTIDTRAYRWADDKRRETGTQNFDVIVCVDGEKRAGL